MDRNISNVIIELEKLLGYKIELCDYFTGVRECVNGCYFNIILDKPFPQSKTATDIQRIINKYGVLKNIEPNGHKRAALFLV